MQQPDSILADPLCMLLSNLTQKAESVSSSLLTLQSPPNNHLLFPDLIKAFVNGADKNTSVNKNANFDFLASSLANMTTLPKCRQALLELKANDESEIARIGAFTEHPNTIRRGGVASVLKWVHTI